MANPPLVRSLCLVLSILATPVFAADPTVTNVQAAQKVGTKQVEIFYDMSGSTSPVFVSLQVSSNGGTSFAVPANTLSGHVGAGVSLGNNKKITWNAGADWNNQLSNTVKFRVTASETPPPGQMVFIPGGTFQMGDAFSEGSTAERPVHSVYVNGFYLQNTKVTKTQWDAVRAWGLHNGYTDLMEGSAANNTNFSSGPNHPVHIVTWYDTAKWCNARSQMEGLMPCYTVGGVTYKTGSSAPDCNWNANGYRLPTEAEWEKAARGGATGLRFPWGDTISHSQANYVSSSSYIYDVSPTRGYHPAYNDGVYSYTSPVGSFAPNGYGLYDMAGNVHDWCWDWYSSSYYGTSPMNDPRGPAMGSQRVLRGGGWTFDAPNCRSAFRSPASPGTLFIFFADVGFRPARSSVP